MRVGNLDCVRSIYFLPLTHRCFRLYYILPCIFFGHNTTTTDLEANSIGVDQVLADTSIDTPIIGGKLKIDPRYDLRNKVLDATIGYSFRDTALKVDCQSKELTISQNVGKNNKIIPSLIIGKRDFSLSYCRDLQEGGQVMTTWKPDDSISIQWTDGGWDAIIRAPIEGYYKTNGGVKVSMKQNVDVSL